MTNAMPTRGRLIEISPLGPVPLESGTYREWQLPPDWMTVREYATLHGLPTSDVPRLGRHGKAAMVVLRSVGVEAVPQVWDQADTGQWFLVNTYPYRVLQNAGWRVWA